MPIQRAAFKSVRKDKKRRQRNLRVTSELKTLEKKFGPLVAAKKQDEAKAVLNILISRIAKAGQKGVLHKNTASRRISRLTAALRKSGQTAQ